MWQTIQGNVWKCDMQPTNMLQCSSVGICILTELWYFFGVSHKERKTQNSRISSYALEKRGKAIQIASCAMHSMPCPFPFLKHTQTYKNYMSSMQMQADLFGSTAQTSRAGVSLHGHEKLAQHRSPASFSTGRCCFLSWRNHDRGFRKHLKRGIIISLEICWQTYNMYNIL